MNKPKIRFKGFDGEWEKKMIGSLGTTYSGLSGKTKEDFGQGNAQYVTFLNVLTNAQIDSSILEKVNVNEKQNAVLKNDILFNTSSETPEEVGLCSTMQDDIENVYLNSFCFGFRPSSKNIDSNYLVYLMRSNVGRSIMKILAQGATRYNLSKNKLCETNISTPSLPEQTQIAEYFKQLDSLINLTEKKVASLKQVKQASLQQMFPQDGESTPRIRFKGFDEEWKMVTLGEVIEKFDNQRIPVKESLRIKGDIPYYGANGVLDYVKGYTHDGEFVLLAEDGANDLDNYPVIYTTGKIWVNNHAHVIQGKENIVYTPFLKEVISCSNIKSVLVGGTRAKLTSSALAEHSIKIAPTIIEQTQIANYFSNLDKQIRLQEARLAKLKSVKASCLDLMFV